MREVTGWLALAFAMGTLLFTADPARSADNPTAVPKTVRVAAIQFISRWAKPEENRKGLEGLVREAAKGGARIIVLPETAIPAYMSHDIRLTWQVPEGKVTVGLQGVSPESVAETVPGPSTQAFGQLAKELQIYLTVPLLERAEGPKYYNTSVTSSAPTGRSPISPAGTGMGRA